MRRHGLFRRYIWALLLSSLVLLTTGTPAARAAAEQLDLTLPSGTHLKAELRVPAGLRKGERVPAILLFGGFQNAGRVLDLVKPDRPVILASFDYPFTPPRTFQFPESLKYAPEAKRMIRDTSDGIRALAEKLAGDPRVAPGKITAIGASLGAPFCLAAAAQNPHLRGLVLVHGFGDIPRTIAHQLERAWARKFPRGLRWLADPAAFALSQVAWFYVGAESPEESARRLLPEQQILLISAEQDSFVPREASDSLWTALLSAPSQSERILMPGDHLQPGSEALISELMKKIWKWADRAALTPGV